jgi:hypothetical protein
MVVPLQGVNYCFFKNEWIYWAWVHENERTWACHKEIEKGWTCHKEYVKAWMCHKKNKKVWTCCKKMKASTREGMIIQCCMGVWCKHWALRSSWWFVIFGLTFN